MKFLKSDFIGFMLPALVVSFTSAFISDYKQNQRAEEACEMKQVLVIGQKVFQCIEIGIVEGEQKQ